MLTIKEADRVKSILGGREADLAPVFAALSDATRCKIFRAILSRKKLCVTDIVNILDISMPSASQHLKVLETNGLLLRKREGREIYYSANTADRVVKAIQKVVA